MLAASRGPWGDPLANKRSLLLFCSIFASAWLLLALLVYQRSSLFLSPAQGYNEPPGFAREVKYNYNNKTPTTSQIVTLQEADQHWLEQRVRNIVDVIAMQRALPSFSKLEADSDKTNTGEQWTSAVLTSVPKPVDRDYKLDTYENIPGVEDVHAELQDYINNLTQQAASGMSLQQALDNQQHRPTAASLKMEPFDPMNETESLPTRIQFLNTLHTEMQTKHPNSTKVAIASTISFSTLISIRRELIPWLQYHVEIGIAKFYLLYDGNSQAVVDLLSTIPCVELFHIHSPWAAPSDIAIISGLLNGTLQWQSQPGNYNLMVKQGYSLEESLKRAKLAAIDWLIHLDPDELLFPSQESYIITAVLEKVPSHVPAIRFMNLEGQPEIIDVQNRYEQVTLFRVHKHFITPEAFHWRQQFILGANTAFMNLYVNGKSAVRVNAPDVRNMGPHFFTGRPDPRWSSPTNPLGNWVDAVSHDTVILHYAYSYLSDVRDKSSRSCPEEYVEAAKKGDKDQVKKCFVLDMDRDAFLAAATDLQAVKEFYYSRMLFTEGSVVKCGVDKQAWCNLFGVERLKYLLLKVGLLQRHHAPNILLKQHEKRIQSMLNKR